MLRIQHLLVANVLHIIVRNKEYIIDVRNKKKDLHCSILTYGRQYIKAGVI